MNCSVCCCLSTDPDPVNPNELMHWALYSPADADGVRKARGQRCAYCLNLAAHFLKKQEDMKEVFGETLTGVEAVFKAVSSLPTMKEKWDIQRNAYIEQKKQRGGGSLRSFVVQRVAKHEAGSKISVQGPQYDFWMPAYYQMAHGTEGKISSFTWQGQAVQGVWQRATQPMLPHGVICRASWEEYQSSATETTAEAAAHDTGALALPMPEAMERRPDLMVQAQPQNAVAPPVQMALALPLQDQEPKPIPEGPFKDIDAMVHTMFQLSKPPEKASVAGLEKEFKSVSKKHGEHPELDEKMVSLQHAVAPKSIRELLEHEKHIPSQWRPALVNKLINYKAPEKEVASLRDYEQFLKDTGCQQQLEEKLALALCKKPRCPEQEHFGRMCTSDDVRTCFGGFLELSSSDLALRTHGLKILRSFKTGFAKQLLKQVSQEDMETLEAEAAEAMAREVHLAQLECIRSALAHLAHDISSSSHQEALSELLAVSPNLPDDVAAQVTEIRAEVLATHLQELENAADEKRPLPPCPSILSEENAAEAEKFRNKLTSQQKFAEEMKALRSGSLVAFYHAASLLPTLEKAERDLLQTYVDENEEKLDQMEVKLLKLLFANCKEVPGLFETMSVLVKEGLRKNNAATLRASAILKRLANLPKDEMKSVQGWHAGKCLLEDGNTNTPSAANFWATVLFFQKWAGSWSAIFPVGEALHFKPAFFSFVKDIVSSRAGDGAAYLEDDDDDDCSWCGAEGNDISLPHCKSGKLLHRTAANLCKLVEDLHGALQDLALKPYDRLADVTSMFVANAEEGLQSEALEGLAELDGARVSEELHKILALEKDLRNLEKLFPADWSPLRKTSSDIAKLAGVHTVATYFEVLKKDPKEQPQAASHALSERAAWLSEHGIKVKMPDHHETLDSRISTLAQSVPTKGKKRKQESDSQPAEPQAKSKAKAKGQAKAVPKEKAKAKAKGKAKAASKKSKPNV